MIDPFCNLRFRWDLPARIWEENRLLLMVLDSPKVQALGHLGILGEVFWPALSTAGSRGWEGEGLCSARLEIESV